MFQLFDRCIFIYLYWSLLGQTKTHRSKVETKNYLAFPIVFNITRKNTEIFFTIILKTFEVGTTTSERETAILVNFLRHFLG